MNKPQEQRDWMQNLVGQDSVGSQCTHQDLSFILGFFSFVQSSKLNFLGIFGEGKDFAVSMSQ